MKSQAMKYKQDRQINRNVFIDVKMTKINLK